MIICAKNEAANLHKNLPFILKQQYPNFEVIVVNDRSTDKTLAVLENLQIQYANLRILTLKDTERQAKGKKYALAKGIEFSRHDLLLLTDADCQVNSEFWIKNMSLKIQGETDIALGYGPCFEQNTLINSFIRFETVFVAIQYLSFALIGLPYMGVGRNLIYKKKLFNKIGGFKMHEHIASGDDDLFINQVATKENTKIVILPTTFMYSEPKYTWKALYRQKTRHLSTGRHYRPIHQLFLGLISVSHIGVYFFFFLLLLMNHSIVLAISLFVSRLFIVWFLFGMVLKKLDEPKLFWKIPLLDFLYLLYYFIFTPAVLIGKSNKWT